MIDWPRYYSRGGQQLTRDEWEAQIVGTDRIDAWEVTRRVGLTTLGSFTVSTVWLGMDHQYGEGPPLIFETMIFGSATDDAPWQEGEQWRYSTEAEAAAGHARVVEMVRESQASQGAE